MPADQIDHLVDLLQQGRLGLAEATLRTYLNAQPESAPLHNIAGTILLQKQDLRKAVLAFKRAIKCDPSFAPAYCNLGLAYSTSGDVDKAIKYSRRATELAPDDSVSFNNLGNALATKGQREAAADAFTRAIKINSGLSPARNGLALIYLRSGRFDAALTLVTETIRRDPQNIDAHLLKASILETQNRLSEAEAVLEAIPQILRSPRVQIAAARIDYRQKRFSGAINKLEAVKSRSSLANLDGAELHYLLGSSHEQSGDYAEAVEHYEIANAMRADTTEARQYDKRRYLDLIKDLRRAFDNADKSGWACERAGPAPVFLVGFPRSGNTLVNKVLSGHPEITTLDELPVSERLLRALAVANAKAPYFPALSSERRAELQEAYLEACYAEGADRTRRVIVDKMPFNIIHAAQLQWVFPNAKFLFCLRHPCDAVFSSFKQHFQPNDAVSNFHTLQDAAHLYDKMMSLWRAYTNAGVIAHHYVYYEDFVRSPSASISTIASFLGLEWREEFFHAMDRNIVNLNVLTPSYRQVFNPIDQNAVYHWRNFDKELEPVMEKITPWIEFFGYGERPDDKYAKA